MPPWSAYNQIGWLYIALVRQTALHTTFIAQNMSAGKRTGNQKVNPF